MKTEVYSWRLSAAVKEDLEREARSRKVPVSSILEEAVHEWLHNSGANTAEEEEQSRLHAAVEPCLGVLDGGNPRRAETARETLRSQLRRRYGR